MIIASVNASRLVGLIRQFPSTAGVTMDSFLNEQARLLVSSSGNVPGLVQVTPPHGNGAKGSEAKKQGENATAGDIYQVYATPGKVYAVIRSYAGEPAAARWWKLWKTVPAAAKRWLELSAPNEILRMSIGWDGGTAHEEARGRNGRVRGRARVIVLDELRSLQRYVKKKQRNVGLLAAAIPVAVGSRYGVLKGVPAWIKRHSRSYGYVREKRTSSGRQITLGISQGAVRDLQRRFTYTLKYRMDAWQRQLPFLVRKLERRLEQELASA